MEGRRLDRRHQVITAFLEALSRLGDDESPVSVVIRMEDGEELVVGQREERRLLLVPDED